jgi:Lrp/AsnC family transcriptional regulator for asnA, asnC and gidA
MDELDKKILRVMQRDCRKSFREISKEVGSTPVTVINRVRAMEKAGVIRKYAADLNYEKLGYTIKGVIGITAENTALKKLEEEVLKFDAVKEVYEVTGPTDVIMIGHFKDMKDLQMFVKEKLMGRDSVKTITHVVTKTYKESPIVELK